MIRVSDYIFKTLAETYHVEHVFMVTGGGAMHLNDALRLEKRIVATIVCIRKVSLFEKS
jgi:acetolactate synthase-1/2/3 large subunit